MRRAPRPVAYFPGRPECLHFSYLGYLLSCSCTCRVLALLLYHVWRRGILVRFESLRLTRRPHFDTLSQAIAITLPTIMLTKVAHMDVSRTIKDSGNAGPIHVALLICTDLLFGSELQAISR